MVSRELLRSGSDLTEDPYLRDGLTYEANPHLLETLGGNDPPFEREYDDICEEHGRRNVEYVCRLFYLKSWKKSHGEYPYSLSYLQLKAILAIEEEIALRTAKQAYDSAEKSRQMQRSTSAPPTRTPSTGNVGGIQKGVPVNRF